VLKPNFLALPLLAGALFANSAVASAQTAPAAPADSAASAAPAAAGAPPAPQAGGHHRHRKNRMMAALRGLNLSDDQKTKIEGFMTSYRDSRTSATPETRGQLRAQVESVLTPDQRTQFDTKLKHHGPPAPAPAS
jgi:Spy/CpxP family protein refolding chaperone